MPVLVSAQETWGTRQSRCWVEIRKSLGCSDAAVSMIVEWRGAEATYVEIGHAMYVILYNNPWCRRCMGSCLIRKPSRSPVGIGAGTTCWPRSSSCLFGGWVSSGRPF